MAVQTLFKYSVAWVGAVYNMFRENTGMLSPGGSYDLYPVNNDPVEGITLVLVGIPFRNQLSWVKIAKKNRR